MWVMKSPRIMTRVILECDTLNEKPRAPRNESEWPKSVNNSNMEGNALQIKQ